MLSLIFLAAFVASCRGNFPEYTIDRTQELFGLTVYMEYLYFPGDWLISHDNWLIQLHYKGKVNTLAESDVFNPKEEAWMEIFDCGNGYACIQGVYENYWFALDNIDYSANFYQESSLPSDKDRFRFKIYCSSSDPANFDSCNLVVTAFGGDIWQIYAKSNKDVHYCKDCGSPEWFRWRIKIVDPLDFVETESTSMCNNGTDPIEMVLGHQIGSINEGGKWDFNERISKELNNGMTFAAKNGLLNDNEAWLTEVGTLSYEEKREVMNFEPTTIPAGQLVVFKQLRGYYGPYKVYSNVITSTTINCI